MTQRIVSNYYYLEYVKRKYLKVHTILIVATRLEFLNEYIQNKYRQLS